MSFYRGFIFGGFDYGLVWISGERFCPESYVVSRLRVSAPGGGRSRFVLSPGRRRCWWDVSLYGYSVPSGCSLLFYARSISTRPFMFVGRVSGRSVGDVVCFGSPSVRLVDRCCGLKVVFVNGTKSSQSSVFVLGFKNTFNFLGSTWGCEGCGCVSDVSSVVILVSPCVSSVSGSYRVVDGLDVLPVVSSLRVVKPVIFDDLVSSDVPFKCIYFPDLSRCVVVCADCGAVSSVVEKYSGVERVGVCECREMLLRFVRTSISVPLLLKELMFVSRLDRSVGVGLVVGEEEVVVPLSYCALPSLLDFCGFVPLVVSW